MSIKTMTSLKATKLVLLIISLVSTSLLSGCMKSSAATQVFYQSSDVEVTDSMLTTVNNTFRTTIPGGTWRYQGAQAINGTINAYIQIPEELKMSRKNQVNYLKMSLCPSAARVAMWDQLQGVPLSVHVYVMNKKQTVFANCTNPKA